jgi:hypothetical protein
MTFLNPRNRVSDGAAPTFRILNTGWNADPNAPDPQITIQDGAVRLEVRQNRVAFDAAEKVGRFRLVFEDAKRFRLTPVNDHGWYDGQCRFSDLAPAWGEFYEILGDTMDDLEPTPWRETGRSGGERHFHFYLRDDTFECKARGWHLEQVATATDEGED